MTDASAAKARAAARTMILPLALAQFIASATDLDTTVRIPGSVSADDNADKSPPGGRWCRLSRHAHWQHA
jgi:hypothetical protein